MQHQQQKLYKHNHHHQHHIDLYNLPVTTTQMNNNYSNTRCNCSDEMTPLVVVDMYNNNNNNNNNSNSNNNINHGNHHSHHHHENNNNNNQHHHHNNNHFNFTQQPQQQVNTITNWSTRILQDVIGLLHILSPTCKILYCSESCIELTGYHPNELIGKLLTDFLHVDDLEIFSRNFTCSFTSLTRMKVHYRIRKKDNTWLLLESIGQPKQDSPNEPPQTFFAIAQPYLSKSNTLLDSFLELKMENEWLKRKLNDMMVPAADYQQQMYDNNIQAIPTSNQGGGDGGNHGNTTDPLQQQQQYYPTLAQQRQSFSADNNDFLSTSTEQQYLRRQSNCSNSTTVFQQQIAQQQQTNNYTTTTRTSSVASSSTEFNEILVRYQQEEQGGGGIVAPATAAAAAVTTKTTAATPVVVKDKWKRRKKQRGLDDYVCADCGTTASPEWRKGPHGPKTLCNACGLRWAKKKQKDLNVN